MSTNMPWHQIPFEDRDLPEFEAEFGARGKRNLPIIAGVNRAIENVHLVLSDPQTWEAWKAVATNEGYEGNDARRRAHEVHQHTFEFAERWGQLMQAEMQKGASLESIAAYTATRANLTANGRNYISEASRVRWNAVTFLETCWVHGPELRALLDQRPDIIDEINSPARLAAVAGPPSPYSQNEGPKRPAPHATTRFGITPYSDCTLADGVS